MRRWIFLVLLTLAIPALAQAPTLQPLAASDIPALLSRRRTAPASLRSGRSIAPTAKPTCRPWPKWWKRSLIATSS